MTGFRFTKLLVFGLWVENPRVGSSILSLATNESNKKPPAPASVVSAAGDERTALVMPTVHHEVQLIA